MTLLHRIGAVLRLVFDRKRAETDLDDDVRSFIEMAAAERIRDGVAPEEARRLAALELGGAEQVKEQVRTGRHGGWLDEVGRDVRQGLRQVRRNPGFSLVAIATLALGIGANTAMFSAVDAVLIRPLPYTDPEDLVIVFDDTGRDNESKFYSTPAEWAEWRRHNTVFTDIAASQPGDAVLSGDGDPEELPARKVSGNFWSVLGVQPLLGRVFTEAEDTGGARVVVISHGLWQRRFGGSPDVVGRTVTINDTAYEVVGVMSREFYFLPARDIDLWMPTSFTPAMLGHWSWHDVDCIARLKAGMSLQEAQAAMAALSLRVSAPHLSKPRTAVVSPLRDEVTGKTSTSLIVLLAAAASVLLIACLNLANLVMARGAGRRREVAVRVALGAGRARLIRQFLIESLVLAGLGALAGLAFALPAMRFLESLVPATMGEVRLTIDARVLAASAAIALLAGITVGLMPAVRGSRLALQEALRDGGRGSTGARSHRLQQGLIVAQTALAVALLTIGGLLLQTFRELQHRDLGLRRDQHILTFVTPLFRYPDFDRRVAFVEAQLEKVRAVPGVLSAAAISEIPLTVNGQARFYRLQGQSNDATRDQVALSRIVTRDYFATIGARLREGRFFEASDRRSDAPAAIVNESFANRHYPGRSALGARFQFERRNATGYWYTIVGVVREIRDRGAADYLQPTVYRLHEQANQGNQRASGIVVRTAGDPSATIAAIRHAIWSVDSNQPIARIQTIDDIVTRQLAVPSQNAVLLGAFALLALVLASIGLYGVLAYAVAERTNEIGVRMALGASTRDILVGVGARGIALTVAGLAIGLVLGFAGTRAMRTLFYELPPDYLSAAAAAATILLAVAAVACFIPARRASHIDPIKALQQE